MMAKVLLLLWAAVSWVPHEAGSAVPPGAIRASTQLFVCQARLQDGVHSGVTAGGPCLRKKARQSRLKTTNLR